MDEGVASDTVDARDRELGSVMRTWAQARDGLEVELLGPLDARGMDPTWVLRLRSELLEAGAFVGGEEGLSDARLIQMLDALADAGMGADLPTWLRPAGLSTLRSQAMPLVVRGDVERVQHMGGVG